MTKRKEKETGMMRPPRKVPGFLSSPPCPCGEVPQHLLCGQTAPSIPPLKHAAGQAIWCNFISEELLSAKQGHCSFTVQPLP